MWDREQKVNDDNNHNPSNSQSTGSNDDQRYVSLVNICQGINIR